MRKRRFIKNALLLTITGLILRFVVVFFRIWLSNLIGAEGMGLYQVIISVHVFASAFAASGLMTAVTRQVADRLSVNDKKGAIRAFRMSVLLTLLVAFLSLIIIFIFAEQIAVLFIKDIRAVPALKTLSFSLPFMGVASCFKGYFLARRNAKRPSAALILEQAVRILLVFVLCKEAIKISLSYAAAAVLLADCISEAVSMLYMAIGYYKDKKAIKNNSKTERYIKILKENLRISMPITAGKYLATFLRTVENILMPQSLAKYTSSYKSSLSQFGMIKGMALPILFFPASLLNSITTLLIPEVSEAKANNDYKTIKNAVIKSFQIALCSAYIIGGIFLINAKELGVLIYSSEEVGYLIKALAPLVPIMYLDSMADGLLKGLDKQNNTLVHGLIDSVFRISFIYFLVPSFGMKAFLGIMFISNILTCSLNSITLLKHSKVKFDLNGWVIKPIFSLIISLSLSYLLMIPFKNLPNLIFILLFSTLSIIIYIVLLYYLKVFTKNQVSSLYK